jgi:MBG domain (YGX type)
VGQYQEVPLTPNTKSDRQRLTHPSWDATSGYRENQAVVHDCLITALPLPRKITMIMTRRRHLTLECLEDRQLLAPSFDNWFNWAPSTQSFLYGTKLTPAILDATTEFPPGQFNMSYMNQVGKSLGVGSVLPAGVDPITVGWSWGPPTQYACTITLDFNVSKAPLTISATPETMVQGNAVPALAVNYTGFVDGQTPANLTVVPTASTTATSKSLPGQYAIGIVGAVDPNYEINYALSILTVTPPAVIGGNFVQFTNVTTQGLLINGSVSVNGTTIVFNANYDVVTNGHPGTDNVHGSIVNGQLEGFSAVFTSGVHDGLVYYDCVPAGIFISPTEIAVNFTRVNLSNHPAGPMQFTIQLT